MSKGAVKFSSWLIGMASHGLLSDEMIFGIHCIQCSVINNRQIWEFKSLLERLRFTWKLLSELGTVSKSWMHFKSEHCCSNEKKMQPAQEKNLDESTMWLISTFLPISGSPWPHIFIFDWSLAKMSSLTHLPNWYWRDVGKVWNLDLFSVWIHLLIH